ncbi:hypothetical protein [Streptomyces sp. NPDC001914]|uniref:hypothetical protein n=1 Tax=Streptomyces sp. NPDC001914 TaxID=3364623 RepID=UPI0036BDC717
MTYHNHLYDGIGSQPEETPEQQLAAENRRLRALNAALTERLEGLQRDNEGAYRDLAAANGGARFDRTDPFPPEPPRKLGQVPMPMPLPSALRRFW